MRELLARIDRSGPAAGHTVTTPLSGHFVESVSLMLFRVLSAVCLLSSGSAAVVQADRVQHEIGQADGGQVRAADHGQTHSIPPG